MEIAIPLFALGGLYVISNQQKNKCDEKEGFLPNTNIPNKNYPSEFPVLNSEMDQTTELTVNNRYDGNGAFTDKFFNASVPDNQFATSTLDKVGMTTNDNYQSLAGQSVGSDYFRHNNMVPYFGSKIRNRQVDVNATESLMDNYLGAGSQTITKKEQSPLFIPSDNYQWAHGAPNQSDFYQSRVNPSMRMANVKPFEEERVGPGLGLGYTTEGSAGFNSGMMARDSWMEKTVDELRVANHQKASGLGMFGYEGPANSYVKELGSIGHMEKNRVTKTFEMGPDRLMTTTGVEKGQTLRAVPIERNVNRPETSAEYIGGAGAYVDGNYVDGEYMPSKHIDLGPVPFNPATSTGKGGGTEADYGVKSQYAYPNNRSATNQNNSGGYFGMVGGAMGAVVAPLLDMLRPSRRENTIGNLRPYENASSKVPLSYIFNPADRAATTIRETTENSKFHLQANARQNGGAYAITKQQPIANSRMTQSDFYYSGNASAGERGREARAYDAEYSQRNNDIKSSTIDGRMVPGNMSLMNNQMNITQNDKNTYLQMSRGPAPGMPYQAPSMNTMGQLQGKQELYSNIQTDRVGPDYMTALKGNPYALSITR